MSVNAKQRTRLRLVNWTIQTRFDPHFLTLGVFWKINRFYPPTLIVEVMLCIIPLVPIRVSILLIRDLA